MLEFGCKPLYRCVSKSYPDFIKASRDGPGKQARHDVPDGCCMAVWRKTTSTHILESSEMAVSYFLLSSSVVFLFPFSCLFICHNIIQPNNPPDIDKYVTPVLVLGHKLSCEIVSSTYEGEAVLMKSDNMIT